MSDGEEFEEVCGGLFACDNCCGLYADDVEGCVEGCTATLIPCWEDDEDDPCACDCGCCQVQLVTKCDAIFCGLCSGFASSIGSCFTNLFECFGAVFSMFRWLFDFKSKRLALYGADVDPTADGRNWCMKNCFEVEEETEHYLMIIFTMLLSMADTATDVLVIHKWLTSDPNEWEAITLMIVLFVCWSASAWLRMKWIPGGDNPYDDESCLSRWFCSSLPFHFVGLGVVAEGFKSLGDYDGITDNYRNINPFKWVEVLFESGPSALITIYVISKESINANESRGTWDIVYEVVSICISLFSISVGMANIVTSEIPRGKTKSDIGENYVVRTIMASFLILSDLVFRLFLIVMWVNYGNILGIKDTWAKFLFGMGTVLVFEMIMVSMNGMIAAWWQVPIQAYTQIFQGGVGFFNRSWPREDKANKGHKRNVMTFFLRYVANWAVFLWIYFDLSQRDGTYISKPWTDPLIIAAAIEPVFFMLKPPSMTAREVFPFIQVITELGWTRGKTTFFDVEMAKTRNIPKNPAGNRVNWQSDLHLSASESSFVQTP